MIGKATTQLYRERFDMECRVMGCLRKACACSRCTNTLKQRLKSRPSPALPMHRWNQTVATWMGVRHKRCGCVIQRCELTSGHCLTLCALQFSRPSKAVTFINTTISNTEVLYVADSENNMIRTVTAVCSKICENGGACVTEEQCLCTAGWEGDDCTVPICSDTCKSLPCVC